MKQTSIITSVESRITVPQLTLSNFYINPAEDNTKKRRISGNNTFSKYFEEIDWSSTSSEVEGTIEISFLKNDDDEIDNITLPVTTSFIFTCTKGRDDYYEVAWVVSLS